IAAPLLDGLMDFVISARGTMPVVTSLDGQLRGQSLRSRPWNADQPRTVRAPLPPGFHDARLSAMILVDSIADWLKCANSLISRCTRVLSPCKTLRKVSSSA